MFDILDKNSGDIFRGLLSKYFPELPAGTDSPSYSYLIAPIEAAFNTYHALVKKDLNVLRTLVSDTTLTREYIEGLPAETMNFFGTLHGMSRLPGVPVWGVLKLKMAGTDTYSLPEMSFSYAGGNYRTYPAVVEAPANRLVYISYAGADTSAPLIPYGTEITLSRAEVVEAYAYVCKAAVPAEGNYEYYTRVMTSVAGRTNPVYNLLISSAVTVSGNEDITIVGARDNRMFRDIVAIDTEPTPVLTHAGGKVDIYTVPNQVSYHSDVLVSTELTASQKELLFNTRAMLFDYGVALVDGTVVPVDYPGDGSFIEQYVNNWPRTYELPLDIPVIDLGTAFPGAVLDVLEVSSADGVLMEGIDYVWVSGDRGASFTHMQRSVLVMNPETEEAGTAYTVNVLLADNWESVNDIFTELAGDLVGMDTMLKPYNPVIAEVKLTIKGTSVVDVGTIVSAINGAMIFDLGPVFRAFTDAGTPLLGIETTLRARTNTYWKAEMTDVSTAATSGFIAQSLAFTDLYRFYTSPELITIVEV